MRFYMSNKSIGSKTLKAGAALLAVGAGVAALNAKNKNGTEKKKIKEIQNYHLMIFLILVLKKKLGEVFYN